MSDQGTPRDDEEEQQQHDDDDEHQQQFDDEQQDSPSADAATAASVSGRGVSVSVADEKPAEESKRAEHDDDVAHAPRGSGRQQQSDGRGGGGDDAGTDAAGEQDEAGLQEAAAGQLEELEEPAAESEQGSQTNQQQQQHQQQYDDDQQHQQQQQDDDPNYPNSVGTDSAPDSHAPQRQVYDDDGGAEPDADPSAADYNGGAQGFDQSHGDGSDGAERPAYIMPDILRVVINREELELEAEEEEERELNGEPPTAERTPEQIVFVQIIKDNLHHPKLFLGGFRHKYYGTLYHHCATQTARKKKKAESVKFHRETQTIQIVSRSQQTNRERGTQMERSDLIQDHSADSIILSRPYFTADELEALRESKAKEIQCFLRQCFAWRRVRRLRETKAEQVSSEIAAAEAKRAKDAAEHALQIQRRMHPRTKQDFAVLFAELEAWRLHETQRIKESGLTPEEISIALQELLNKEVKLLQTIDRLKITAARENKWARTASNLESMASPKEWSSREGDLIEVETPFTTRAKELVDLYNGLCLRGLARAQRVDVLLHVKYTVKEFDCELSREIVELIKREEDLLRRQRSEQSLEGCRKRLQNLFLHFVNTPTFNPEAQNFQRVADPALSSNGGNGGAAGQQHGGPPPPALSSSLAKPAMLTKTNTITVATNVAGRIFAEKNKQ